MRKDQPLAAEQPAEPGLPDQVPSHPAQAGWLRARLDQLGANHPASPRYREDTPPAPAPGGCKPDLAPLDDRAYAAHTRMVEARLKDAHRKGLATEERYTTGPGGKVWLRERAEAQREIINEIYQQAADISREGKAVIVGGLGGAGKTTVLDRSLGIDRSKYLVINPDQVKEKMAERGMIPEVEGLSPMERSTLVHEESSLVASDLAQRAYSERRNVIWDITMSSRESAGRRIDDLRAAGYQEIVGVFVDIPAEKSVERALARHRHGLERYRAGEGLGGRYLPPDLILRQQAPGGETVNRQVFEELKPRFDRWLLYDNSVDGRDPVLVESSEEVQKGRIP
jgi:predicted ABC-type ATPase